MHSTYTLLQVIALASLALGSPAPLPPTGGNVDQSPNQARHLEKRRNIDYCFNSWNGDGTCADIGPNVAAIADSVAERIKENSDNNDCGEHSDWVDDVYWTAYATTSGGDCRTSAEKGTIQGALSEYLRNRGENLCGNHCLKLTHGGTWTSYVALGTTKDQASRASCEWVDWVNVECDSAGKGDI